MAAIDNQSGDTLNILMCTLYLVKLYNFGIFVLIVVTFLKAFQIYILICRQVPLT